MTVLITGGAGYIGSHMVWKLLDEGEKPVVIDRLSSGHRSSIPNDIPFYHADIEDQALVSKIMKEHQISSVIHFAGSISVPESMSNPLSYYRNNTINSQLLIEAAIDNGIEAFIFSSTAAVYGTPIKTAPVIEETPLHPQSPYGYSKMMAERILMDTSNSHQSFNASALRYFNVSGADPKGRTGQSTKGAMNLIKLACETASGKRDFVEIYGTDYNTPDGTCIRDYIHVTDLVEAHFSALNRLRTKSSSFIANCGYGKGFSVREVVEMVRTVANYDFEAREAPRRPGDIVSITANNNKIRSLTDWQANHDTLKEIVGSSFQWEQMIKERIAA